MSEQPPPYQPAPAEQYGQPAYAPERKPSTALIAIGWVFAGLALLVPLLGIVGLIMGIILWAQGWPRQGVPIVVASVVLAALGVLVALALYY